MAREGWTSIPQVLRRRNYERVFAFISKHRGLAAHLRPVKSSNDTAMENEQANEQADRMRIRVALENAFGTDHSSIEYFTRTLASDAAHELRRLIQVQPTSSKQLAPIISYVHSLRTCLLQAGTEKGLFDEFLPILHASYLACLLTEFDEGPGRVVVFLRAARRLPEGATLPKICEKLIATGNDMEEESPELDKFLKELDLLPQLYLRESTLENLTKILDTLALDHTWHDRMDQLEADVRGGKLVDYDTLKKKGREMVEKGEWIQSNKKVNKKYIRDDKKVLRKDPRGTSSKIDKADSADDDGGRRRRRVKRKVKNREDPPDVINDEDEDDGRRRSNSRRNSRNSNVEKTDAPDQQEEPAIIISDNEEEKEDLRNRSTRNPFRHLISRKNHLIAVKMSAKGDEVLNLALYG